MRANDSARASKMLEASDQPAHQCKSEQTKCCLSFQNHLADNKIAIHDRGTGRQTTIWMSQFLEWAT